MSRSIAISYALLSLEKKRRCSSNGKILPCCEPKQEKEENKHG
jgi:hypothetical protein